MYMLHIWIFSIYGVSVCLSMSFMNIECPLQGFWVIVMQLDLSIVTKKETVVARIKASVTSVFKLE